MSTPLAVDPTRRVSLACRDPAWRRSLVAPLALLCAAGFLGPAHAAEITLTASLSAPQTIVGRAVSLSIECSGAQDVAAPSVQAPDGITVTYLGPATQVSIINGRISSSVSHRYSVTPVTAGVFTLGPFTVSYGGQQYRTAPVSLEALPASGASGHRQRGGHAGAAGNEVSLVLEVNKGEAFLQEQIPATVTLFVGNASVDRVEFPTLPGDGFAIEPFAKPEQTREVRDGRTVQAVRFRTVVTPLHPGPLVLGPAAITISVMTRSPHGTGDPFFDRFFTIDPFGQRQPVELHSGPVEMTVRALPQDGKPDDFAGAVGRFDLEVSVQPVEVRVGDPITVRMRVSGTGSLATVSAPLVDAGADFKVYSPQVSGQASDGGKVFEQVLIPLRTDVHEVPAARLSFFDPAASAYHTVSRGPFPVAVQAAERADARTIVEAPEAAAGSRAPEQLGRDIVYIKEAPGTLAAPGVQGASRRWFFLLHLLTALGCAGAWGYARRRERLTTDPRYARFVRAGRDARRALAVAEQALRRGGHADFDDALSRALRQYLSAKLDLPPGAVDAAQVAERLSANGTSAELIRQVTGIFALLERVRYSPRAGEAAREREAALGVARSVVAALDREGSRPYRTTVALLLVIAMAAASARAGAVNPHALFYKGNEQYSSGHFDAAAAAYEGILAAGVESPAVYYNLANAYTKSGKLGPAILNYERARRLAPRDPDIRANLRFARDQDGLEPPDLPLWRQLLFPVAERCSTSELTWLTGLAGDAALVALAVRFLYPPVAVAALRLAVGCGILFLIAGASLGDRMLRYEMTASAVVTLPGDTPVRFEPSTDGTTHFVAHEGTLLRLLEERNDWAQVARDDGRRGWIERRALQEVATPRRGG